ncbi:hypothetical protein Q1695_000447 [Nippostrongylus brasiliensis]|nr:hypothetical protein Q1695_000447 [Nippostrongylus brasiliensis]
MASSEYTRAFLLYCTCMRSILIRFPRFANFLAARRSESMVSCNMSTIGMQNKDFCSGDSFAASGALLQLNSSESNGMKESSTMNDICERRLKGILITGDRLEGRGKKNLTIINTLTSPLRDSEPRSITAHL